MDDDKEELENDELENSSNLDSSGENIEDQSSDASSEVSVTTSKPASRLSGVIGIIKWFMRLPSTLKLIILYILGGILAIFLVAFLIFMLQASATEVSENLFGWINEGGENISEFFDDMLDFITDPFNPDLVEKARKAQEAYYKKLQDVYEDFEEKYEVKIDTTLITATLFYEKTIGDYIVDVPASDEEDDEVFKDEIDFYKNAKKYVKTLAKFQIIENSTFNTCRDEPEYFTVPETTLEIANAWVETFFGGFNSRRTFNAENFRDITYTKANGTPNTIKWCNYWDADTQLSDYYEEDKNYVEELKGAYYQCEEQNQAVSDNEASCMSQCSSSYPNSNSYEYMNCGMQCKEEALANRMNCYDKRQKYEEAYQRFYSSWISTGFYNEDGDFQCRPNAILGSLDPYDDDKHFVNRRFIWNADNTATVNTTPGGVIACSAAPAIYNTYSMDISREGVYYHKLLSRTSILSSKSFIERYYPNQVDVEDDDARYNLSVEVVDGIYDLYEEITDRNSYAIASNLCPNGVQVVMGTGEYARDPSQYPIGTFSLEDYVAMVVNGENNSGKEEAMKAQIVAARTYTLARTDGCTKPIRNSIQDQVARANPSEEIKELVRQTAGEVLMYNGNIFSAEYDSFDGTCSGGMCTAVYEKLPNRETHTVTIPASYNEGIGGHGRGMSQCAANYMADQGFTYQEILKYFYSPGVEIVIGTGSYDNTVGQGVALSPSGIAAALASSGYTLESYSNEMFMAAKNSGLSTRQAVLTVANYATSKFYNITGGLKLNYKFGGDVSGYGFTSNFGLDCSGFVSWVLHNAGFNYKNQPAYLWGEEGSASSLTERRGVPGDLIVWKSYDRKNRNDHVAIIIGVDEGGYYTAEAYSTKEGIVNVYRPFNLTSSNREVFVVDMTSFYERNKNTSNYPGGGV